MAPLETTDLLNRVARGDKQAELRRMAAHHPRQERTDGNRLEESHAFFGVAAQLMRHIRVDYGELSR